MRLRTVTILVAALSTLAFGVFGAATASAAPGSRANVTQVTGLQADYTTDPLGIDDMHPSLSWQLRSTHADSRQTAYRVLVATSPRLLTPGRADVWDSGRVDSSDSVGVQYDGPTLRSSQRYYWTVQVWTSTGRASGPARAAWWEMGLLSPSDWQGAQWISPNTAGQDIWSNFILNVDFTMNKGAASVVFRAQNQSNLYLWQVNEEVDPGEIVLRPHVEVNGNFIHLIPDLNLSPVLTPQNIAGQHHLEIEANGPTITTWVDGQLVDTLTDSTFASGTVGFRVGDSTEDSLYDNLSVTNLDGSNAFTDDFSSPTDPSFPGTQVVGGELHPGGGITLMDPNPDSPQLRDTFTLDGKIASARVYADGLGFYEMHLNGHKVGDNVLETADAPYDQRDLYQTYDITHMLHDGSNAVGIWLGNGYGQNFNEFGFRWLGPQQAIALIKVTYADGRTQTITTGPDGWTWSASPITANDIYNGESFDAGLADAGWDTPGFDASSWKPVTAVPAPGGAMVAADMPPIKVVRTLKPVALTEPEPGVWVFDFGQNVAGWEQLHVAGPAGTTVQMQTAENILPDGLIDTTTNRNAAATDRYTLAGTGSPETWEPRFTYHGFQYVEVTGFPGTPTLASLSAKVVHASVQSTGTFTSSDPLLNRIWQDNRRTIINNTMSVPTDNPVRDERTPPGMDVQAYHDASIREFNMDRFYANYLQDMPPGTALPNDAGNAQQPDMGGDQVTLAWALYQEYGDKATLASMYPLMKAFVDTNATDFPDHIWPDNRGFGDWCPPVEGAAADDGIGAPNIGSCTSEVSLVNTALSYVQASDVAKAAQALGNTADAAHYAQLASDIKDAFNVTFLNAAGDGYGDGQTQTTSILPLAFGMVPAADVQAVGNQLVNTIMGPDSGHLDTGIFGTRYLMDALAAIGRPDVAMTVLNQTTYPGFGYEISQGATTDWEQWTYFSNMESHDHAMFSGINASLYTDLAGITATSPGYATISIAPDVPAGLAHVAASIDTVRGKVVSSWTQANRSFTLRATVPANATAVVSVPLLDGRIVRATRGARLLGTSAGVARYAVGSGNSTFTEVR